MVLKLRKKLRSPTEAFTRYVWGFVQEKGWLPLLQAGAPVGFPSWEVLRVTTSYQPLPCAGPMLGRDGQELTGPHAAPRWMVVLVQMRKPRLT